MKHLDQKSNTCLYFGSIAEDEDGQTLKDKLTEEGVTADWSINTETYTGKCACVIVNKERALCADLGAAIKYDLEHMKANIAKASTAKVVYSTGFFISSCFEGLLHAAKTAHENGQTFAINFSATFIVSGCHSQFNEVIQYADFIFGNDDEMRAYSEAEGWETSDVTEMAKLLAEKFPDKSTKVVTTQGTKPVVIASYDAESKNTTVEESEIDLLPTEEIKDLNGAGDAFIGGFLCQYARGKDMNECIKAGKWMSKYII